MSYYQNNQNPYQQGPAQEGGYSNGYEMHNYSQPQSGSVLSQNDFLNEVTRLRDEIAGLNADVEYINQLHQRSLSSSDEKSPDQLEQTMARTKARHVAVKNSIKDLERDLARTAGASRNVKTQHLQTVKNNFQAELDRYQGIERDYEHRYRDQIMRQYRIVNPDASEQELQDAANADWSNEGVFQTALRTNRTGNASSVLGNVRARHSDLQRIEATIIELSQIMQDLATAVEQHEPQIVQVDDNAEDAKDKITDANGQIATATESARRARRYKWYCLLIVVIILIAIAIGVAAGICTQTDLCHSKN